MESRLLFSGAVCLTDKDVILIFKITFIPFSDKNKKIDVPFDAPVRVYDVMAAAALTGESYCGGNHSCGKCFVLVKGKTEPADEAELGLIKTIPEVWDASGVNDCEPRLACYCMVTGDAVVYYYDVKDGGYLKSLIVEREMISRNTASYGAAVDIGTTTVECALYELVSKKRVYYKREVNAQRVFGADVLTRIERSNENGFTEQHYLIKRQIEIMLRAGIEQLPAGSDNLIDLVVTGNTTMLHFFEGLDPGGIGVSPFRPESLFGSSKPGKPVFSFLGEQTGLYIPPCVGPYIGADISCGMLAAELYKPETVALLIDVGTNGEIALSYKKQLYCCSTAAGPAFEGGEITMGMIAADGAVSNVELHDEVLAYTTIGNRPPSGICGTGIISAVSALLKAGIVDTTGRILPEGHNFPEKIFETDDMTAVYIAEKSVYMTQKDIRNIQLAKAAVAAGIDTLLEKTGIKPEDVDKLYLCGGFGSGIKITAAAEIGLFPGCMAEKTVVMGNSALSGAEILLYSKQNKERIENIVQQANEISLSSDPYFMERYIENMGFIPKSAFGGDS